MTKDQMPEGCSNCGAHAGESQSQLRKVLKWDGSTWVCSDCMAAVKKPWEPYNVINFNGEKLFASQPFESSHENGEKTHVGYACETFPIKWRLEAAMENLTAGNIGEAMGDIGDALREIHQAEARKMPVFQLMPDNFTILESGKLI